MHIDSLPPVIADDEDETPATVTAYERAQRGEPLGPGEMAEIWRVKHTRFNQLEKAGAFDLFLLKPAIGQKRYSGIKVWRYLCGDPVYEPSFGRKRRPV